MTTLNNYIRLNIDLTDIKQVTQDKIYSQLIFIDDKMKLKAEGIKKLNSKKTIMNYLNKNYKNLNTRKTKIEAIKSILSRDNPVNKKLLDFYKEESHKLHKPINDMLNKNEFTQNDKDKMVSWEEIVNIKPKLCRLDHQILHQFIVVENLFLRLAMFNIKLKNFNKDEDNYIDGNKLVMNNFKNVNQFGKTSFILKDSTIELINHKKGENLFDLSIDSKKRFIQTFFNTYLKKKVNNNLLRKIYINKIMETNPTNSVIKTHSDKMLNSITSWIIHYKKLN